MNYSVIQSGSKQYIVEKDDEVLVEKVSVDDGSDVTFDTLLRVKGKTVEIGEPLLDTAVTGKVIGVEKGRKVQGMKYERSGYRKKFGHRQQYTRIRITKI